MQDWLTVIGVLLIIGILLDGLRRMRNAKRDSIRMSPNMKRKAPTTPEQAHRDRYTSELPNGGARIISTDTNAATDVDTQAPVRRVVKPRTLRKQPSIPQQVTLNLDESVPMLMESIEDGDENDKGLDALPVDDRIEPSFANDFSADELPPETEPGFNADASDDQDFDDADADLMREPDEVIIINVMMQEKNYFQGEALLDVLLQSGMRFGDMNIFHRHVNTNGEGSVLFGLANMVKPGDFNLDSMSQFQTPGVSLFMTLPLKTDSLRAFDTMKQTAEAIATALGGELKDEDRNRMTHQAMEHCRQRIQDYERKRLSRAGA